MTMLRWGRRSCSIYLPVFLLIIGPFLLPYYFQNLDSLYGMRVFFLYLSQVLMGLMVLKFYRSIRAPVLLIAAICTLTVVSTILGRGTVDAAVKDSIRILLLCMTVNVVMERPALIHPFLTAVKYFTLFFWVINLVLSVLYPHGIPALTKNSEIPYLLYGNINATIKYILPGILCSMLLDARRGKRSLGTILFFAGILFQFVVVYHMATTLAAAVYMVVWAGLRKRLQRHTKGVYLLLLLSVFLILTVIVLLENQNIVASIAGLFQKDSTFSGRRALWENAMVSITEKPIFGHGVQEPNVLQAMIGNTSGSHNYYLDMVVRTGFVGLDSFLLLVLYPLRRSRTSLAASKILYLILGCCGAYLIMFLFEPFYGWDLLYLPVFFSAVLAAERCAVPQEVPNRSKEESPSCV